MGGLRTPGRSLGTLGAGVCVSAAGMGARGCTGVRLDVGQGIFWGDGPEDTEGVLGLHGDTRVILGFLLGVLGRGMETPGGGIWHPRWCCAGVARGVWGLSGGSVILGWPGVTGTVLVGAGDTNQCNQGAWGQWWRVLERALGTQGGVAGGGIQSPLGGVPLGTLGTGDTGMAYLGGCGHWSRAGVVASVSWGQWGHFYPLPHARPQQSPPDPTPPPLAGVHSRASAGWGSHVPGGGGVTVPIPGWGQSGGLAGLGPPLAEALMPGAVGLLSSAC